MERFADMRAATANLAVRLGDADATLQSMEDASPAKWHLAHTNWFWETFLLRDHAPDYRLFNEEWPFLFNSYYEAEGERIDRFSRGLLSRPTLDEIGDWRAHVSDAMVHLLDDPALGHLVELGIAHEQQHQELLLTDIKHAFFHNPLAPAMWDAADIPVAQCGAADWHNHPGGIALVGHDGAGFAYDNEGPQHRVILEPFALAPSLVSNAEWSAFIADGGYDNASLWLSDGWAWVQQQRISAPLYWDDACQFTHAGWQTRDPHAPVTHISYYEADAFATWAGARLPTEFEWEAIAQEDDSEAGNQFDGNGGMVMPVGSASVFGDCWQFTRSAYLPYPRFRIADGAVGEYNGKFMSGQFVLRGSSCATARGHSRASYRNFFYPHQRWQFTGLRLAKDL
ncbi:ergothioneine biosynthesis protein EgtB [Altererythrobacter aquiaggeris]|uniref:ergothioneine biosynthesis protein EgtB n=1 Tax=Aestuarierythrobacter aquiaggeris TaxID=1898396 RepID=UPI003015C3C5